MKILLITGIFPPEIGGASVVYHQLALHLGSEMSVLAPTLKGLTRPSEARQGFSIFRVPFFELKNQTGHYGLLGKRVDSLKRLVASRVTIGVGLIRLLRRTKPDIVCLGQPDLYWVNALVKRFTSAPVVFYIHGEEVATTEMADAKRIMGRLGGYLYSRAIKTLSKADAVVTVSRFSAAKLTKVGVSEERIRVIYNGVDHGRFGPGERDPVVLSRHGLAGKRVLLTIARLDARKGHDRVVAAMPAILQAFPNAVYLVVGDGPERGRLEVLVRRLSLQPQVLFAGRIPDDELCAYYRTCDLFIQPNRTMPDGDTEGFGLVFLEAGACAKPVIGGNAGGVPEAIVNGRTGLLVDGESEVAVAEAVMRLLSDPFEAEKLGANGRDWASQFSWAQSAQEFRKLSLELGHDIQHMKVKWGAAM